MMFTVLSLGKFRNELNVNHNHWVLRDCWNHLIYWRDWNNIEMKQLVNTLKLRTLTQRFSNIPNLRLQSTKFQVKVPVVWSFQRDVFSIFLDFPRHFRRFLSQKCSGSRSRFEPMEQLQFSQKIQLLLMKIGDSWWWGVRRFLIKGGTSRNIKELRIEFFPTTFRKRFQLTFRW